MENSKIGWTDHTFNPWIGCTKVSAGCTNCYAEYMFDRRFSKAKWGPQGERKIMSYKYWSKAYRWNRTKWSECDHCGWRGKTDAMFKPSPLTGEQLCFNCSYPTVRDTRQRIFGGSLCDVFERKVDQEDDLLRWRKLLFAAIEQTKNLDWLLLTKRPENIMEMVPPIWKEKFPSNIWIGTSAENQETANTRIPELLKVPASVRFLSAEPLLGKIVIGEALKGDRLDWVIIGGESGPGCRPMETYHAELLTDDCEDAGIPVYMKQMGGHPDKRETVDRIPRHLYSRAYPISGWGDG